MPSFPFLPVSTESSRSRATVAIDHRAARIALNARPRPKREFRAGDEVAVWRRGRGIKNGDVVAGEVRGNYWVSMPGSFVKCSPLTAIADDVRARS